LKISMNTVLGTTLVVGAMVFAGQAFAQSNVTTDSSVTTDTTTDTAMKSGDSIKPDDASTNETKVQKRETHRHMKKHKMTKSEMKSGEESAASAADDSQE
jgi:pentapeptide MXKDX repeat protein